MGFSIGNFLGSIAPLAGFALGGPIGAAIGGAVSAGFSKAPAATAVVGRQTNPVLQPQSALTSIAPVPFSASRISGVSFNQPGLNGAGGGFQTAGLTGLVSRGVGGAFGAAVLAGTALTEILSRARQNTGGRVTKNRIIDAARSCGIELAAGTFGLSETDVCKVIVAGRTRRRRGISAADIRRTKRTLRFVRTIKKDLKAVRL